MDLKGGVILFYRTRKIPWKRYNYKKTKSYNKILFLVPFLLGILLIFFITNILFTEPQSVMVLTQGALEEVNNEEVSKMLKLIDISDDNLENILCDGCPVFTNVKMKKNNSLYKNLAKNIGNVIGIFENNPEDYLKYQLAYLSSVTPVTARVLEGGEEDFYLETSKELEEWHFEMNEDEPIALSKDPTILIYNTHNAENYLPGKSRLEGKNAGVVEVGDVLTKTLEEKYGIKTIHSHNIHDYPDWSRSYINSMQTAKKLLTANKTIKAVFDIHRDAGFKSKKPTTAKIQGKNAAKILLVIATGHDNWKENLRFAQKLEDKANELYPGLVRDIRIRNNRVYNQHLHPQGVLLEFGTDLNYLEEAKYSARLFAKVLSSVLHE